MAGLYQTPSRLNAVTREWIYSIDDQGIHRSTPGYPGSQTHDYEFAEPVKNYLKRNNLTLENIQSVKVDGNSIVYLWENDSLIFSTRSQTWNKE